MGHPPPDSRAVAAGVLAVLALVASGCGNERHDFRVNTLDPLVHRMSQQRAALASVLRVVHPHRTRDAQTLRGEVATLGATMRRVAALSPPHSIERKFRHYVQANTALLTSLSRFVDAFAKGSAGQRRRTGQEAQAAVGAADQAQTDLLHALG